MHKKIGRIALTAIMFLGLFFFAVLSSLSCLQEKEGLSKIAAAVDGKEMIEKLCTGSEKEEELSAFSENYLKEAGLSSEEIPNLFETEAMSLWIGQYLEESIKFVLDAEKEPEVSEKALLECVLDGVKEMENAAGITLSAAAEKELKEKAGSFVTEFLQVLPKGEGIVEFLGEDTVAGYRYFLSSGVRVVSLVLVGSCVILLYLLETSWRNIGVRIWICILFSGVLLLLIGLLGNVVASMFLESDLVRHRIIETGIRMVRADIRIFSYIYLGLSGLMGLVVFVFSRRKDYLEFDNL